MSVVPIDPLEPIAPEMWAALDALWPNAHRIGLAFRLAVDLETCHALLAGLPVHPDKLNPDELTRARRRRLVRLDFREIDLLGEVAA